MPKVSASFHVRTAKTFSYTSQPFKLAVFAACKKASGSSLPSPKAPRVYRQRTFRLSKLAVKCPVFERMIGHLPCAPGLAVSEAWVPKAGRTENHSLVSTSPDQCTRYDRE